MCVCGLVLVGGLSLPCFCDENFVFAIQEWLFVRRCRQGFLTRRNPTPRRMGFQPSSTFFPGSSQPPPPLGGQMKLKFGPARHSQGKLRHYLCKAPKFFKKKYFFKLSAGLAYDLFAEEFQPSCGWSFPQGFQCLLGQAQQQARPRHVPFFSSQHLFAVARMDPRSLRKFLVVSPLRTRKPTTP